MQPNSQLEDQHFQEVQQHEQQQQQQHEQREQRAVADAAGPDRKSSKRRKTKTLLSQEKLRRLKEQQDRRGIIYISRLPPHMKPAKLRQLLSQYGEIGRIYCTPEDAAARKLRKKKGGNSGKNFTEGWVEFEDRSVAKSVAAGLNGQQMGGRRRSSCYYDLWCMKYLPKFKWDHLTEEITYEKAVREQRMAQELAAAKRERDFYLSRVDRAKAQEAMQQRRQAKQQQQGGSQTVAAEQPTATAGPVTTAGGGVSNASVAATAAVGAEGGGGVKRSWGQRKVKPDATSAGAGAVADDLLELLVAPKKKQRSG